VADRSGTADAIRGDPRRPPYEQLALLERSIEIVAKAGRT
jgi:hypothetical protein